MEDGGLKHRERQMAVRRAALLTDEVATAKQNTSPGQRTRSQDLVANDPTRTFEVQLATVRAMLPALATANLRRDAHASANVAATIRSALATAERAARFLKSHELETRVAELAREAAPVLAGAFTPSRATIDEALQWGSTRREQWDREVAVWVGQPRAREQIASSGVDGASSSLPHVDAIQRSFGHHDVTSIRAQIGGAAIAASAELGARAYAFGDRIAFAASPDLHTAAHEAAHVVQQRGNVNVDHEQHADLVADAVVRGDSAASLLDHVARATRVQVSRLHLKEASASSSTARAASNADFVKEHLRDLLNAIAERIERHGVVQPHRRLPWSSLEAGAFAVANAIRSYIEAAPHAALARLAELAYPADLDAILDASRKTTVFEVVKIALAEAFDDCVNRSIPRMGMRLRVYLDRHPQMPAADALVTSSPLDRVIAEALVAPHSVVVDYHKAKDTPGTPFANGTQNIKFAWIGARDANLWNWIEVTSPANATVEDVASSLVVDGQFLGTDQAYRIASSPPYFGIPVDVAARIPEALDQAPAHIAIPTRSAMPVVADPSAFAQATTSDAVALAQAPRIDEHDFEAERALARARNQIADLHGRLAPYHLEGSLTGATAFLDRRQEEIARDPKAASRWRAALVGQQRVLFSVASEVAELTSQPTPGSVTRVLAAYARAAGMSHLGANAAFELASAHTLRSNLELGSLDDKLRNAAAAAPGQNQELESIANRMADVRHRALVDGRIDHDALDRVAVDADELALRASMDGVEQAAGSIERAADLAEIDKSFEGGLPTPRAAATAIGKKVRGWRDRLDHASKWTGPVRGRSPDQVIVSKRREAVELVASAMARINKDHELERYLKWAQAAIENRMFWNLMNTLAKQIAIMIVTGRAASAATTLVRGVALGTELVEESYAMRIAFETVELALQSGGQVAIQGHAPGESYTQAFFENFIAMAVTSTVLRPFGKLLAGSTALENDLRTISQRVVRAGGALAVENAAGFVGSTVGHSITHNDYNIASADVVTQGFALAACKLVERRTRGASERLERAAKSFGEQKVKPLKDKVATLFKRAAAIEKPSPEDAMRMLEERHTLLEQEHALYTEHGDRALATATSNELGELGSEFADVPLAFSQLSPVVQGHSFEGTAEHIETAIAHLEHVGLEVKREANPASAVRRITIGARTIDFYTVGTIATPIGHSALGGRARSPGDQAILDRVIALDATEGRRLIDDFGDALLDYLRTNPLPTLHDLESTLVHQRNLVTRRVHGLYEGIDSSKPPAGWRVENEDGGVITKRDGTKVLGTRVYGPNGAEGYFERAYNPNTRVLELRMAFLRMAGEDLRLPSMVSKQGSSPEMIAGKGTPTVQFVTLYQMRLLGVEAGGHGHGSVKTIHMSDIQNVETIVHLHYLRQRIGGEPSALIEHTASMKYAETTAVQTGYARVGVPKVIGGHETSIQELVEFQERKNPKLMKENDQILAKYGFDRGTKMFWGFDIDFEVRPTQ